MKKAIITGIRGQDGAYLAKLLLEKGYTVYGADRRSGGSDNWRLRYLGIQNKIKVLYMDLLEYSNIKEVISKIMPDEVYNLAAQSFVAASFSQPILTADVDAMGVLRLLDIIKQIKPDIKFYQASTSEMFGKVRETPQNESTPFHPRSPYAVSKVFAHYITQNYRESYGMFACSGILFNHESELRGMEFVTRKITSTLVDIKYGLAEKLLLGNLDSKRDWGYAPEYVEGMHLMLQQENPDDYVLSTGKTHTVRDFIERSAQDLGFDLVWDGEGVDSKGIDRKSGKTIVEVSKEFYRPAEVDVLVGDSSKAQRILGWESKTTLDSLIDIMIKAEIKRAEKMSK